jgi:hypothetical protein
MKLGTVHCADETGDPSITSPKTAASYYRRKYRFAFKALNNRIRPLSPHQQTRTATRPPGANSTTVGTSNTARTSGHACINAPNTARLFSPVPHDPGQLNITWRAREQINAHSIAANPTKGTQGPIGALKGFVLVSAKCPKDRSVHPRTREKARP